MIYIGITATKRYAYAIPNCARRLASALCREKKGGKIIFVTDRDDSMHDTIKEHFVRHMPKQWATEIVPLDLNDDLENYKDDAQLLIAQMQGEAMSIARRESASKFFSLEADVLVPSNALRVLKDCLRFDDGYYDIAMCTYPSQGGGSFLGGRGDYEHFIADDFLESERVIPKELTKRKKEHEKIKHKNNKWHEEYKKIVDEIRSCPPKDNVYALNGKRWRKRGWMEYAYPSIGKGAILPTDWVGMGCTLLSKKALDMAHFDGYEGKGTQDLYLGWNRWKPAGLNMCVTTHAICDHVIRMRMDENGGSQSYDNIRVMNAYHEPDGEYIGHLRQRPSLHYTFVAGEKSLDLPEELSSTIVEEKEI